MPPLAFAHSKNAAADFGAELKSMPPLAVASARTLIGSPVAGLPLPIPHFSAEAEVSSFPTSASPLSPDDPPQAATPNATATTAAATSVQFRVLVNTLRLLHVLRQLVDVGSQG